MATPKIEANLGGTWVDVTADDLASSFPVRHRMRVESGVRITRGRPDQFTTVAPGRCQFELNNQDGKYSPRNPLSDYFGQLGRNTPVRVSVPVIEDQFNRSVSNSWGKATSGHAWTIGAGTAANFDVNGSAGTIVTGDTTDAVVMDSGPHTSMNILCKLSATTLAGDTEFGITTNWTDANNHYRFTLDPFSTDSFFFREYISGSVHYFTSVNMTISAGVSYWIRVNLSNVASGTLFRAKAWADGSTEPSDWQLDIDGADVLDVVADGLGDIGIITKFGTSDTVVVDEFTVDVYRFHGEVKSWPQRWDQSGNDVSTLVEASGILDRLTTNTQAPLQSPMFREATKDSVTEFIAAYWPCEDGEDATQLASVMTGAPPITFVGPVTAAQSTAIPGSKPLPTFGEEGNISCYLPQVVDTTGKVYFRIVLDVPETPTTSDGANILNIYVAGGSFIRCALIYNTGSSGSLEARAIAADQSVLESASLGGDLNGTRLYLSIELVQDGSDISFLAARNEISDDNTSVSSSVFTDTWSSMTVGTCYRVTAGSMVGWGFGHIGVGNDQKFMFSMADALIGNSGETAGNRAIRVAEESGIALQVIGDPDDSPLMGPQVQGAALDVLRTCEAADGGILYESRNEFGLSFRLLSSMLNQDGPTLDYDDGHVNIIEPNDEQDVFNDVTVSRTGGSSARATLDEGLLSTQEPPDGAGRLQSPSLDIGVRYDEQLPDVASWLLHQYTWDEQRFRTLGVQHAAPALQADADLRAQLAALDTGDMVPVDNPPTWLPPDQIRQLVQGYTEAIGVGGASKFWQQDWNTTPYGPYVVGVWGSDSDPDSEDTDSRYDTAGSELSDAVTTTATSWTVATTSGQTWTTDTNDLPFDVMCEGERVTVTAVDAPISDAFDRSSSNGWGTADAGGAWTRSGGSASDFSVSSGQGRITSTTKGVSRFVLLPVSVADFDIYWTTSLSVVTTGDSVTHQLTGRYASVNSRYRWEAVFGTGGGVNVAISKVVSGSGTTLDSATSVVSYSAGTLLRVRSVIIGEELRMKLWLASDSEPDRWTLTATDTSLTAAGQVGFAAFANSGNTNTDPQSRFDDVSAVYPQVFTVTRSINGVVKAHSSGADLSLADPVVWAL